MTGAGGRIGPGAWGIVCVLVGMTLITVNDSIVKWLSPDLPLHQIVAGRGLIAVLVTLAILRFDGGLRELFAGYWKLHAIRGVLFVVATFCLQLGIAAMPLAEAIALFFFAPLFITAMSWPVLGERVGVHRWAGVLVGFAGVVTMLRPGAEIVNWAGLLPIASAIAYGAMQLMTRRYRAQVRASAWTVYMHLSVVGAGLALGLAIGDGRYAGAGGPTFDFLLRPWIEPNDTQLLLILGAGLLNAGGIFLVTQAYRLAEAGLVAPLEYIALPVGIVWGYILWRDLPDAVSLIGMLLIVGGGVYVLHRETGLRRRPPSTPAKPV